MPDLPLGRVAGFRGRDGEVTVRVASGRAERWTGLRSVRLVLPDGRVSDHAVEASRAYGDRLVLRLHGIGDASSAAALRGAEVLASAGEVPELPEGEYYVERLIGLLVVDEAGRELGRVTGIVETGGADVLEIESDGGREWLLPLAREIVPAIDVEGGRLTVRLPEGLLDLNEPGGGAAR